MGGLAASCFPVIAFIQGNPVTSALGPLGGTAARGTAQGEGDGLMLSGLENRPEGIRANGAIAFGCHGREGRLALA
jgi:hypothetical protein